MERKRSWEMGAFAKCFLCLIWPGKSLPAPYTRRCSCSHTNRGSCSHTNHGHPPIQITATLPYKSLGMAGA